MLHFHAKCRNIKPSRAAFFNLELLYQLFADFTGVHSFPFLRKET